MIRGVGVLKNRRTNRRTFRRKMRAIQIIHTKPIKIDENQSKHTLLSLLLVNKLRLKSRYMKAFDAKTVYFSKKNNFNYDSVNGYDNFIPSLTNVT